MVAREALTFSNGRQTVRGGHGVFTAARDPKRIKGEELNVDTDNHYDRFQRYPFRCHLIHHLLGFSRPAKM